MSRSGRGALGAYPGRLTLQVPISLDLLAEADRIAAERGEDRAIVLGDLVAAALPDALAEVAADRLRSTAIAPRGATPGEPNTYPLPDVKDVAPSLPPGDPEREAGSAGPPG